VDKKFKGCGCEPRSNEELYSHECIASRLVEALEACIAEAEERDEDMGANCWPEAKSALAAAYGQEP